MAAVTALDRAFGLADGELRRIMDDYADGRRRRHEAELEAAWNRPLPMLPDGQAYDEARCGCTLRNGHIVRACDGAWEIHDAIMDLLRMPRTSRIRAIAAAGERAWDRHIEAATGEKRAEWKRPRRAKE